MRGRCAGGARAVHGRCWGGARPWRPGRRAGTELALPHCRLLRWMRASISLRGHGRSEVRGRPVGTPVAARPRCGGGAGAERGRCAASALSISTSVICRAAAAARTHRGRSRRLSRWHAATVRFTRGRCRRDETARRGRFRTVDILYFLPKSPTKHPILIPYTVDFQSLCLCVFEVGLCVNPPSGSEPIYSN